MKLLLTIASLLLVVCANAQTPADTVSTITTTDTTVYFFTDVQPEFPGGEEALNKFWGRNYKPGELVEDCNCHGQITYSFIVEKDGNITHIKIEEPLNNKCEGYIWVNPDGHYADPVHKNKDATKHYCAPSVNLIQAEVLRVIGIMPKWAPGNIGGKPVRVIKHQPLIIKNNPH